MPGLFGLIKISKEAQGDKFSVHNLLKIMADSLLHRSDYVLDTAISELHGIAIGRISHPFTNKYSWPQSDELGNGQGKGFLYGMFTNDYTKHLSQERLNDLPLSAEEILQDLEGYYSLVLTNRDLKSVILAGDRKGSEPLFYFQQDGIIFFAPEVKALLAIFNGPLEINPEAAPSLLACGHLLGDQTLISSIKRLSGGSFLQIQPNKIEKKFYWVCSPGTKSFQRSEEELKKELVELLKQSVEKCLENIERTAFFLSGGLDSRGVLAGALIATGGKGVNLNTICWGVAKDIPGSDAVIAQRIAREFNLNHTYFERKTDNYSEGFLETNYLADGLSDVAAFHPFELTMLKRIKEMGMERVLRGDAAVGYYHRVYNFQEAEAAVGIRSIRNLTMYKKILRPEYYRLWSDGNEAAMVRMENDISGMDPTDAKDYLYFTHRLQNYLHSCASYKRILFGHLSPFLDDSILEFISRVPWQLRADRSLFRKAVLAIHPPLSDIPSANYSGLENWNDELCRKTEMGRFMQNQIDDSKSGIWGYFDRNAVTVLFNSLSSSPLKSLSPSFKIRLRKKISGHIFSLLPRQAERIRAHRFQHVSMPHQALMRFLVLKNWHDTFVSKRNCSLRPTNKGKIE